MFQRVCWLMALILGLNAAWANEGKSESAGPPHFSFEPAVVCNLRSEEGEQHMLQLSIDIMVKEPETLEPLKKHEPQIRSELILLLSEQTIMTMNSIKEREAIRKKALEIVKKILKKEGVHGEVTDLYFTNVIIE